MSSPKVTTTTPADPKIPAPSLGVVLWAASPGAEWYPALATSVGFNSIDCAVFTSDSGIGVSKLGARWHRDPQFFLQGDQTGGVWDFCPLEKRLMLMQAKLDPFFKEFGEPAVGDPTGD